MKKSVLLISVAVLILVMLAYTLTKNHLTDRSARESCALEEGAAGLDLSSIKTEVAIIDESLDMVTATGKVDPNMNKVVLVGSRIDGKIMRVYANVGDTVHRGQVLATLSSIELAQARAAYRLAASKVHAAKESYDRQVKLAKLGAFSKRPVEEARSEHLSAQGELTQARSELIRAESELAACKARMDRAKELYKDQIVSRQDMESAEAEYKRDCANVEAIKAKIKQADAQVKISKTYLSREEKVLGGNLLVSKELQAAKAEVTAADLELRAAADTIRVLGASPGGTGDTITITSPISGRVVSRSVNIGEVVDPSKILFTVMDLSDVWIEANIYEKDLAKIRKGQAVEIRVESYRDRVFPGKITYISDVLDSSSRTAKVRCAVSNSGGALKPEMFATVNIITARRGSSVMVPKESVLDDEGKKIAFVPCMDCKEDKKSWKSCGTFDKREVVLGSVHNDRVEVKKGIMPGEEIVTVGAYQLKTALGAGKLEAGCCP